jgi:hypothetical protein
MEIVLLEIPLVAPPTASLSQMTTTILVPRMIPPPESTFHPWPVPHQPEDQLNANKGDTGLTPFKTTPLEKKYILATFVI